MRPACDPLGSPGAAASAGHAVDVCSEDDPIAATLVTIGSLEAGLDEGSRRAFGPMLNAARRCLQRTRLRSETDARVFAALVLDGVFRVVSAAGAGEAA